MKNVVIAVGLLVSCAGGLQAQPDRGPVTQQRPQRDTVLASVGPGTNMVSIKVQGDMRVIQANGWPDHAPGQFPNRGNPNAVRPQSYTFRVTTKPSLAERLSPDNGAFFGVALNGVPFEPGTAEFWGNDRRWNYEAMSGFVNLGLDQHNAHVQPTGGYHYHGLPIGLIQKLGGTTNKMTMVGYAADGFPIYTNYGYTDAKDTNSPIKKLKSSYQVKKGTRQGGPGGNYDGKFTADYEYVKGAGDLDECNGRVGPTPEYPQGTYYYCITEEFPQLSRYWKGTGDASFRKGPPGGGRGGPGGPGGPGGRGGPPGGPEGGRPPGGPGGGPPDGQRPPR